jgi:uncharacterized alpha-E superfamily protein
MLLSRVAESVYWAGRYLERAEATARLVRTHTELYLDLPRSAGVTWAPLLAVTGSSRACAERYGDEAEDHVVRFLTADLSHSGSIVASLSSARDNFRVTRAVFPKTCWEMLNRLHNWASDTAGDGVDRRTRIDWMDSVIHQTQQLGGLLAGTMSHDHAYSFLEVGRMIERADMTTRVLDVQGTILLGEVPDNLLPYADVVWMHALRSLSAHQMFRRAVGRGVSGPAAIGFLLRDEQFPRSVEHCLTAISRELLELPRYELPMSGCAMVQEVLEDAEFDALAMAGLREFMDGVQVGLASLHDLVAQTYFQNAATPTSLLATA